MKDTITNIVIKSKNRYGYRRVTLVLKNKGILINHKKVLRIMKELNLLSTKFNTRTRKYSSYKGVIGKIAPNIINRKFSVNKANKLWLTDITEFKIPGLDSKIYLSPILDSFNGEIVSYAISKHPTIELTNKSLNKAINKVKDVKGLTIHSDQGFHYQHSSWVYKLKEYGIKQSMSRKGNCLDNSPMENFFGILKQEMFYGESFKDYDDLIIKIKEYIKWYNEERIKSKLKGMSPVQYRKHS